MELEQHEYIDFNKVFNALLFEQEDVLEEFQYEAEHMGKILNFQRNWMKDFNLMLDECHTDTEIFCFVFDWSADDANESNPQSSGASVTIEYNTILDEFTSYEHEQG